MEGPALLGSNIKVHFAGSDNDLGAMIAREMADVRYSLYSCYPFIVGKKPGDDLVAKEPFIPKLQTSFCKHTIQDSGLFTLMFGAGKAQKQTLESLTQWQDNLIRFVQQNKLDCTCVEIDCQKVLGVREAWFFRERMRKLLGNRQINVFHVEDGRKGLDSLIDFSDYIAFSIPELRIVKPQTFREDTRMLVEYAKNRKPDIDIHLLGCTDKVMLTQCSHCTSADSTSWLSGIRYGNIGRHHIRNFRADIHSQAMQRAAERYKHYGVSPKESRYQRVADQYLSAVIHKRRYANAAGSQE